MTDASVHLNTLDIPTASLCASVGAAVTVMTLGDVTLAAVSGGQVTTAAPGRAQTGSSVWGTTHSRPAARPATAALRGTWTATPGTDFVSWDLVETGGLPEIAAST